MSRIGYGDQAHEKNGLLMGKIITMSRHGIQTTDEEIGAELKKSLDAGIIQYSQEA